MEDAIKIKRERVILLRQKWIKCVIEFTLKYTRGKENLSISPMTLLKKFRCLLVSCQFTLNSVKRNFKNLNMAHKSLILNHLIFMYLLLLKL